VRFVDEQAASRIVLNDGRVLTKCDQCQQMYAERTPPGTPPCESCRVVLREENEEAAACYMLTRRQYVTADKGRIVDISIPAVKIAMELHGVRDQKDCLNKVIRLFHFFLQKDRNDEG
jgi:hypothetical protein